jgi:transcriptional regulator with XRE-family HTH domain
MTMTLADLRKRAGFSQSQVAKKMKVNQATVSRIEANYPNVMFPSLRRYMDAIDVDIRFFSEGVFDDVSDEVEQDVYRIGTVEGRRNDPTRRPADRSA